MDENTIGVVLIVLFVVYPFTLAGLSHGFSKCAGDDHYRRKLAKIFGGFGLVPAGIVLASIPTSKVPSVNVVGAVVIVLCSAATGAFVGSIRDWLKSQNADHSKASSD
jgi:hypothetical protein